MALGAVDCSVQALSYPAPAACSAQASTSRWRQNGVCPRTWRDGDAAGLSLLVCTPFRFRPHAVKSFRWLITR